MALICVECLSEAEFPRAKYLSTLWGVPMSSPVSILSSASVGGVKVVVDDGILGLAFMNVKRGKPYFVDFLTAIWRSRLVKGLPKSHIFRRALGVRESGVEVIDATAGFGADAALALSLGCRVRAVERSSVVAHILKDGVLRAQMEDLELQRKFSQFQIIESEAETYLANCAPADVVYLDPMFDKPKKTAKSPKEMQLLQELLGESPNPLQEERLFQSAFERARRRVIVKRPLKAKALVRPPSHSFKGQSIRYDVYLKS